MNPALAVGAFTPADEIVADYPDNTRVAFGIGAVSIGSGATGFRRRNQVAAGQYLARVNREGDGTAAITNNFIRAFPESAPDRRVPGGVEAWMNAA